MNFSQAFLLNKKEFAMYLMGVSLAKDSFVFDKEFCDKFLTQEIMKFYPKGTLWQDDCSLNAEGKVDFYIMNNGWEFYEKNYPYLSK